MKTKAGRKPNKNALTRNATRRTFHIYDNLFKELDLLCNQNSYKKSEIINKALKDFIVREKFPKKSQENYRVISLFSGCGGMDLGFEGNFDFLGQQYHSHGFEIVFANDIMPAAEETYNSYFKTKLVRVDIKAYLDLGEDLPECDVVVGGFPCQDFSVSGKRMGLDAERGRLYDQMRRVIEQTKPLIFVAENVKGLASLGNALETIENDFSKMYPKYNITHFFKMAADFGVPQTRERIFIVGTRSDVKAKFIPPVETHSADESEGRKEWVSAKEALADLLSKNRNVPNQNQYSKAKRYGEHCQGNKAIKPNYPGPTIRAEHHGNIEFHYNNTRRLTVRECARLQSFPDNFEFTSSTSKNYVTVGNAVPPVLAWHIAKSVKSFLDEAIEKTRF